MKKTCRYLVANFPQTFSTLSFQQFDPRSVDRSVGNIKKMFTCEIRISGAQAKNPLESRRVSFPGVKSFSLLLSVVWRNQSGVFPCLHWSGRATRAVRCLGGLARAPPSGITPVLVALLARTGNRVESNRYGRFGKVFVLVYFGKSRGGLWKFRWNRRK